MSGLDNLANAEIAQWIDSLLYVLVDWSCGSIQALGTCADSISHEIQFVERVSLLIVSIIVNVAYLRTVYVHLGSLCENSRYAFGLSLERCELKILNTNYCHCKGLLVWCAFKSFRYDENSVTLYWYNL